MALADTLFDIVKDCWTGFTGTGRLRVDAAITGSTTVTGTVTANQGTPNTAANGWFVKVTDGTDTAQVSAAGALLVDGSASTQPVSGTVTVVQPTGTNLHAVIDSGSTTAVTGNVTVVQPTGTNLHAVLDTGSTTAVTQATAANLNATVVGTGTFAAQVTGSVTANAGTNLNTSALNLETTQTAFSAKFPSAAALTDAFANPTTTGVAAFLMGWNGTTWDRLKSTTANGLVVDVSRVQGTVAVTQSTSPWVTSRNWTLSSGTDSVAAVQSGTWNITNITGTVSLPTGAATEATLAKLTLTQGSTTSGQSGPLVQAAVTTSNPNYTTGQTSPLSQTTTGHLRVDTTGSTISITGNTQVDQGNPGSQFSPWYVLPTSSGGNEQNINATGQASVTAANLELTQGSTTSGEVGPLVQGAVTTAAPTYTTAKTNPLSLTTAGALRVDASGTIQPISGTVTVTQATGTNLHAVLDTGSTTTVTQATGTNLHTVIDSGTITTVSTVTNLSQMSGTAISMNNGTTDAGTQRVTLSSDSTGQVKLATGANTIGALTANQSVNVAQIAGNTTLTGNGVTGTGSQRVTIASDNTPFSVNTTSSLSATSTGMTFFRNTALSNTAVAVKASQGNLFYYHFYNSGSLDTFLQLYNVAQGSVTVGTTTPDLTLAVPAGGILDGSFDSSPFSFSTAITIAATTTITGGTAPATALLIAIGYK